MKDEIKEIKIDKKNKSITFINNEKVFYQFGIADEILDYITNLQEENERLKEENKRIFSKVNDDELLISNAMNYAEAQDYKSRIDKAIEYNYELQERYCHSALFDNLVASKVYEITEKQLNILNGGDE